MGGWGQTWSTDERRNYKASSSILMRSFGCDRRAKEKGTEILSQKTESGGTEERNEHVPALGPVNPLKDYTLSLRLWLRPDQWTMTVV